MDHKTKESIAAGAITGLSLLGGAFLAYLTTLHYSTDGSTLCNLGAGFNCHIVNQSLYSELLGIPVAVLGMGYFLGVIVLVSSRVAAKFRLIALATLFSLIFSFYLSGIEVFSLGTVCIFCEASKAVMMAILGVSGWMMWKKGERLSPAHIVAVLAAGALFTGTAHWIQTV